MSGILATEKEALTKEQGKLMKFFAALKKFLAKEFLWVVFVAILALPLAELFKAILDNYSPSFKAYIAGLMHSTELFLPTYVLSAAGIYFIRAIIGSIKTLVKKPKN
ncbi:hypothetical protein QWY87_12895 [Lutimonas halocynthiae]|uniref:hypothetical protein n=1 Tax=Lutimonas halocynthiae TaxID=1446477 RepID=UPI0025B5BA72|nr:hypothetical protein [Lutimonas halocynthiae]MDN3643607.1 hypothetical protein [Lutimonas halocynthiae]